MDPMVISSLIHSPEKFNIFCGFDGFLDSLYKVVKKEDEANSFVFHDTISDFAHKLLNSSELSADIEIVKIRESAGGNAPILARALSEFHDQITLCSCLGKPDIHPLFHHLKDTCRVISIGQPAISTAFEFDDGKLMFGDLEPLKLIANLDVPAIFQENTVQAPFDLICLADWANIRDCNSLWSQTLDYFTPMGKTKSPKVFIDLSDISQKKRSEITGLAQILKNYSESYTILLGMNLNEANHLLTALQDNTVQNSDHRSLGQSLQRLLSIEAVVIHPMDTCIVATSDSIQEVKGIRIKKPLISTGAGDNFNAGFATGWLRDLPWEACAELGLLFFSYYVREGKNISPDTIMDYLAEWQVRD